MAPSELASILQSSEALIWDKRTGKNIPAARVAIHLKRLLIPDRQFANKLKIQRRTKCSGLVSIFTYLLKR
jgi:hypothetical protein